MPTLILVVVTSSQLPNEKQIRELSITMPSMTELTAEEQAIENRKLMLNMYDECERKFSQFNRIVPYNNNTDDVFSPRLVDLLQNIGAQIDGMFKLLVGFLGVEPKTENFPGYFDALNQQEILSMQEVMLKENGRLVRPFDFDRSLFVPAWWAANNEVKHELPKGAYCGTYGNAIKGLAALTILHGICAVAFTFSDARAEVMKANNWLNFIDYYRERDKTPLARRNSLQSDLHRELRGFASRIFYQPMMFQINTTQQ